MEYEEYTITGASLTVPEKQPVARAGEPWPEAAVGVNVGVQKTRPHSIVGLEIMLSKDYPFPVQPRGQDTGNCSAMAGSRTING